MAIFIASDFHCKYQKVAWMDTGDGELHFADVDHSDVEGVRRFYGQFPAGSVVGMETSGYSFWFQELVAGLGLELRIGHSQAIAAQRTRRQKNDQRDAEHMLGLLLTNKFPQIWIPDPGSWTQRKVITHRCRLVRFRTALSNALRALVYNYNLPVRKGSLSKAKKQRIRQLVLNPTLSGLRDELLELIEGLETRIKAKEALIEQYVSDNEAACRLRTVPGIGACSALATVLILGPVERFPRAKSVVSYVGLDCSENSTNNAHTLRRYGSITKQGNKQLRWLLNQCVTTTVRRDPHFQKLYKRLCRRKDWRVAKTAMTRRLLVCLFVLLRDQIDYPEFVRRGSDIGMPVVARGRK